MDITEVPAVEIEVSGVTTPETTMAFPPPLIELDAYEEVVSA